MQAYLRQASKQRVRALRKAYPPDVEFISALHIDCLQSGDDFQDGVLWRSHAERNLFLDVRGWPEASSKTRLFHPLTDILKFEDDSCVRDCLSLLQTTGVGLDAKLRRAAHLLDCTPTISGVRWPHIDVDELKASAVEHPFLKDEFLLLHKRRMPVDVTQPCDVCRDCRAALLSSVLTLPRFSLANDLWMGRQMQPLRNLAAGTRRLLPMIRACLQVTVLQPANLQKEERQRGFVGNSIFLPQAQPSAIRTTLPPPESDMQESILFVLVGQKKDTLASSALLSCPRDEYDAAVSCLQRSSPYCRPCRAASWRLRRTAIWLASCCRRDPRMRKAKMGSRKKMRRHSLQRMDLSIALRKKTQARFGVISFLAGALKLCWLDC